VEQNITFLEVSVLLSVPPSYYLLLLTLCRLSGLYYTAILWLELTNVY